MTRTEGELDIAGCSENAEKAKDKIRTLTQSRNSIRRVMALSSYFKSAATHSR